MRNRQGMILQHILLLAIAGLTLAYLVQPTKTKEHFTAGLNPIDPDVEMTGPNTVYAPAFSVEPNEEDDSRDLPWIASWTAADKAARRGQNCVPMHQEDGPDDTVILTVSKSCEAGMPHTRPGDRIIIPDSVPLPDRAEVIAHELVHIYQRRRPEAWTTFYKRNWSFEFSDTPPAGMPASVIGARRNNPDAHGPWPCWQGRYWPVPVYTDPKNPKLRDCVTVWWDQWRRETLTVPPSAWNQFFGRPAQDEHPNEIAAVMIVAEDTQTEAGRRLNSWWRTKGPFMKGILHKSQESLPPL
jgi:hypothetical protein